MFPSLAYRNVLLDSLAKRHVKLGTKQEEKIYYGTFKGLNRDLENSARTTKGLLHDLHCAL